MTQRSVSSLIQWVDAVTLQFERAKPSLYFGHGTSNAADEAAWLVTHATGVTFQVLADLPNTPISVAQARRIGAIADERLKTRKPLAYLIHEAWLGEHRFYVDERVIVPRSFIAELLRLKCRAWKTPRRILDLCTGSGCLAIVAAYRYPKATVDAVDLSRDALTVARRNVRDHALTDRVHIVESDLFSALEGERYDLILTNPPYVDAPSMRRLPAEYRHEPSLALAAGKDGLDLVRRIVADAPRHLHPGGTLVVELGHNRDVFVRTYQNLPVRWLDTSAGDEFVFAWQPILRNA
ncbi:MAG: 50S ribosomal protein L3 N(5)-glutamine methyltransferase [Burkholderiales bacterium]